LTEALSRAGRVDAILFALHGALVAANQPDVEGALLSLIRRHIGTRVPLVATLDLHANITARMVENADALVLYHTAPHIDVFETGQRGAAVLRRILDGARPTTAFVKMPLVVPAERANTQDPASISHRFCRFLRDLEANPRILSAGLATVQPWLDIPELGSAVVVVTDGDEKLARTSAEDLARQVWAHRRDYLPELVPLADAVSRARAACNDGLVVLGDSPDSTTSGACGDSTHLLAALLDHSWPRAVLVPMVDPEAVAELARVGEGTPWRGAVGGKRDPYSKPLAVEGVVERLFEAKFILAGHLGRNLPIDMGPSAVLRCGDVRLVLTSRTGPHFAPQLFQTAGIDPFAAAVLVAKSPCGFRAAYAPRAVLIMMVQAPGCSPSDFWNFPYRHIPRPLWPWDEMEWQPQVSRPARSVASDSG